MSLVMMPKSHGRDVSYFQTEYIILQTTTCVWQYFEKCVHVKPQNVPIKYTCV